MGDDHQGDGEETRHRPGRPRARVRRVPARQQRQRTRLEGLPVGRSRSGRAPAALLLLPGVRGTGVRRELSQVGAPRGVRHLPRTRRDHERRGDQASRAAGRWARPLHVRPRRRHPCAATRRRSARRGHASVRRPPSSRLRSTPCSPRREPLAKVENGGGRRLGGPADAHPAARSMAGRAPALPPTIGQALGGGANVMRPRRGEDLARLRRQVLAHPHQDRLRERDLIVADLP